MDIPMNKFKFLIQRFKEPSTWASIAALVGVFKPALAVQVAAAAPAVVVVAGALGVFLPEKKDAE